MVSSYKSLSRMGFLNDSCLDLVKLSRLVGCGPPGCDGYRPIVPGSLLATPGAREPRGPA